MNYKYYFSVIIPIYNAEHYLTESIESILNQTIGFSNIQLILVDDGSTDASATICRTYRERYPDNIEYYFQTNKGPGIARNTGLEKVKGKYVTLLDADDNWATDAFEKAYSFFEQHYDEVDLVSCRIENFGRDNSSNYFDYKFSESRIIDIHTEYNAPQVTINSTFIKAAAIDSHTRFTAARISEDVLFATAIIVKKGQYAVLPPCNYRHRKRESRSSIIDNKYSDYDYYLTWVKEIGFGLLDMSFSEYGELIPFFQYLIAYLCRKRPKIVNKPDILSPAEWEEYNRLMHELLNNIDDNYFMELYKISINHKVACLKYKHGMSYSPAIFLKKMQVKIDDIRLSEDQLLISGRSRIELLGNEFEFFARDNNGRAFDCKIKKHNKSDYKSIDGEIIFEGTSFSCALPIDGAEYYQFIYKHTRTGEEQNAKIKPTRAVNVSDEKTLSLESVDKQIVFKKRKMRINKI